MILVRQLNWIDGIIIVVLFYYLIDGWQRGFLLLMSGFISFFGSLWLAIRYHVLVGSFLVEKFGIPSIWQNVLGYIIIALPAEAVLSVFFDYVTRGIPPKTISSKANRWLGALLSAANALVIVAFFLLVILALPLRGTVKKDIRNSHLGSRLVTLADRYGGSLKSSLDEVSHEAIQFLTIKPKSGEKITLNISPNPAELTVDTLSEARMVELVNLERTKSGVGRLRVDGAMVAVARTHSRDMFINHYFSHIDTEGHDAGYRLQQANISFMIVGENLAYAPDIDTAHQGLMESEGHRRNILDFQFHRIGIGVIDGGIYGKLFTQEFAD